MPAVAPIPVVVFPDAFSAGSPLPGPLARLIERMRRPQLPAAEGYALAFGALLRAKAARTLIAAAGIVTVGYLLFAEKFTGTAQDMATVFVWGFTIDVSVDALVDALTKGFKRA